MDVGCGPGIVMEMLRHRLSSTGIDMDPEMVRSCREKRLDVVRAFAENLPFEDKSFDIAYCSWLLLWVQDPVEVLREMRRVSRGWVFCMAEPDWGARIDHPEELARLGQVLMEGIRRDGGDPLMGRKLRAAFNSCGLEPEMGIHPGVWDIGRLREESEGEWEFVQMTAGGTVEPAELRKLKDCWDRALRDGTLFQFNPVFYALARVP